MRKGNEFGMDDIISSYDFMIVTNALNGRRVLVNKMAVSKIEEPPATADLQVTTIYLDKDMVIPAQEKFDDIARLFISEDDEDDD